MASPKIITVPWPATYVSSTDGTGKGARYHHADQVRAIAALIVQAQRCRSCGAIFHALTEPHGDEDCPEGHAHWIEASRAQIAAEVLRRTGESRG